MSQIKNLVARVWEKFQIKKAIAEGLDVKNYPTKWRQAGDLAEQYNGLPLFSSRCKLFLELGGQPLENAAAVDTFPPPAKSAEVSK